MFRNTKIPNFVRTPYDVFLCLKINTKQIFSIIIYYNSKKLLFCVLKTTQNTLSVYDYTKLCFLSPTDMWTEDMSTDVPLVRDDFQYGNTPCFCEEVAHNADKKKRMVRIDWEEGDQHGCHGWGDPPGGHGGKPESDVLAEGQSEEVLVTAGRKRVRKGSIQKKASRKGGVKGVCEIKDKGLWILHKKNMAIELPHKKAAFQRTSFKKIRRFF